jgi:hypothetical protein
LSNINDQYSCCDSRRGGMFESRLGSYLNHRVNEVHPRIASSTGCDDRLQPVAKLTVAGTVLQPFPLAIEPRISLAPEVERLPTLPGDHDLLANFLWIGESEAYVD